MKFTHVLSILCLGIIAPYMIASEATDIEKAYKKEVAKVKQADKKNIKDKKAKVIKSVKEKKAKETIVRKKAKIQEPKAKKTVKAKVTSAKATKTEKKAVTSQKQTTKQVTPKTTRTKKQKTVKQEQVQEAQVTEQVATRRTPNIQTLEPRTVIVGEEFTISRPASPNFGRTWKLHKALPTQIEMVGKEKFVPAEHPSRNEGSLVFTFRATQPGLTSIEFEKVYPPELRDKKPMKVRIVPVEIKESSAK